MQTLVQRRISVQSAGQCTWPAWMEKDRKGNRSYCVRCVWSGGDRDVHVKGEG